jgi:hypothetical protein
MVRGSRIVPDVRYIVIRLSAVMDMEKISIYTGISRQSVKRILDYFASHGTIEPAPERKSRNRQLRDMDVEVSPWAVNADTDA